MLYFLPHVRHDRKFSLEDVGRSVRKDRQAIANLEPGAFPLDISIIQSLATALGVAPEVFTADAITIHRDGRIEVAR